jgi:hypothetical protein
MRLGKTKRELEQTMTMKEFHEWSWFHSQYPIDDFHVHMRPSAMVAQSMAGGEIEDKLNWLQPKPAKMSDSKSGHFSEADLNTLRAFGL